MQPHRVAELVKVKCLRTADCVVGGFRYASKGKVVGSLGIEAQFAARALLDHLAVYWRWRHEHLDWH